MVGDGCPFPVIEEPLPTESAEFAHLGRGRIRLRDGVEAGEEGELLGPEFGH